MRKPPRQTYLRPHVGPVLRIVLDETSPRFAPVNPIRDVNSPPKGDVQSPQASATPKRFRLRHMPLQGIRTGIWTPLSLFFKKGARQAKRVSRRGWSTRAPKGQSTPLWCGLASCPRLPRRSKTPAVSPVRGSHYKRHSIEHIELHFAKPSASPYPCGFWPFWGTQCIAQACDLHCAGLRNTIRRCTLLTYAIYF